LDADARELAQPRLQVRGISDSAPVAFYSVCDERFYPGLVALINSLRVHGQREAMYVVDCGLTAAQRDALSDEVTLLDAPIGLAPQLLKYAGPFAAPADVMVLVDADIIVTRSLEPLIEAARAGKVVAFADVLEHRFYASWSELLGLEPVRCRPYVNSGFLVLPRIRGLELLEKLEQLQQTLNLSETILEGGSPNAPFYFPDQDILNALLASNFTEDDVMTLENRFAPHPPFAGVSVVDIDAARCTYQSGDEPFALHHVLQQKPWLAPTRRTPYSELLPRLWFSSDLAVRIEADEVPRRFRQGRLAAFARTRARLSVLLEKTRGRLGLRNYLRNFRRNQRNTPVALEDAGDVASEEDPHVSRTNRQCGHVTRATDAEIEETPGVGL
jgi:hypothetical protein